MVVPNRLLWAATLSVAVTATTASTTTTLVGHEQDAGGPSVDIAKSRAPNIFNAVHDSMRQWGASTHHNGMSFFLATVPEGVVLHHGNGQAQSPVDPDWLAYEIEHAEGFTRVGPGWPGPPGGGPPGGGPPGKGPGGGGPPPPPTSLEDGDVTHISLDDLTGSQQHELRRRRRSIHHDESAPPTKEDGEKEEGKGGWLHTYLATRPLRYLYIDGMSAGKTDMGTLDTQDYFLRRKSKDGNDGGRPMLGERERAVELCALVQEWGLDGVIRTESGFEIIQCDFSNGLRQLQALQRPSLSGGERIGPCGRGAFGGFEFVRGLAERYHDIGSSRTVVDYSSMVSAYFFPLNLTNPDPARPDLPRLVGNTDAELAPLRAYLNETIGARLGQPVLRTIDWRDVTDLVVGRYADRLQYMAEKATSVHAIAEELDILLTAFLDYSGREDDDRVTPAVARCANVYLHAVAPDTEADTFILAALKTVTTEICTRLFEVRALVTTGAGAAGGDDEEADVMAEAVAKVTSLMAYLAWARFKRCPPCDSVDEVCFIPMWPLGSKAAYEAPRCVSPEHMDEGESYWGHNRPLLCRHPEDGKDGKDGRMGPRQL